MSTTGRQGMTKQERAAEMREQGVTYARIAAVLGISRRTAFRWLNPEDRERGRESSRAYKDRNRDAVRAANRAYLRRPEIRGRCASCGELRGIGVGAKSGEGVCASCRHAQSERRADRIVEMYNAGATMKVIAADIGSTPGAVGVECIRLRKAGRIAYHYAGCAERVAA